MNKLFLYDTCVMPACGPAFAQVDRSKAPEPGPAPEIQLGDYESFTLKNGLKVFVVENNKLPRVAFNCLSIGIRYSGRGEGRLCGGDRRVIAPGYHQPNQRAAR